MPNVGFGGKFRRRDARKLGSKEEDDWNSFLENSISKKINYEYPQCCTLDIRRLFN